VWLPRVSRAVAEIRAVTPCCAVGHLDATIERHWGGRLDHNVLRATRVVMLTIYDPTSVCWTPSAPGGRGFMLKEVGAADPADAARAVRVGADGYVLRMIGQFARSPGRAQRDRLLTAWTPWKVRSSGSRLVW
jgi:hypothetical protein